MAAKALNEKLALSHKHGRGSKSKGTSKSSKASTSARLLACKLLATEVISGIADVEQRVELSKYALVTRSDFNVKDLFEMLNPAGYEFLSSFEYNEFLGKFVDSETDVRLLFSRHSKGSGKVSLRLFSKAVQPVLPLEKVAQRAQQCKVLTRLSLVDPNVSLHEPTPYRLFLELCLEQIHAEKQIFALCDVLKHTSDYENHFAFKAADRRKCGAVSTADISALLKHSPSAAAFANASKNANTFDSMERERERGGGSGVLDDDSRSWLIVKRFDRSDSGEISFEDWAKSLTLNLPVKTDLASLFAPTPKSKRHKEKSSRLPRRSHSSKTLSHSQSQSNGATHSHGATRTLSGATSQSSLLRSRAAERLQLQARNAKHTSRAKEGGLKGNPPTGTDANNKENRSSNVPEHVRGGANKSREKPLGASTHERDLPRKQKQNHRTQKETLSQSQGVQHQFQAQTQVSSRTKPSAPQQHFGSRSQPLPRSHIAAAENSAAAATHSKDSAASAERENAAAASAERENAISVRSSRCSACSHSRANERGDIGTSNSRSGNSRDKKRIGGGAVGNSHSRNSHSSTSANGSVLSDRSNTNTSDRSHTSVNSRRSGNNNSSDRSHTSSDSRRSGSRSTLIDRNNTSDPSHSSSNSQRGNSRRGDTSDRSHRSNNSRRSGSRPVLSDRSNELSQNMRSSSSSGHKGASVRLNEESSNGSHGSSRTTHSAKDGGRSRKSGEKDGGSREPLTQRTSSGPLTQTGARTPHESMHASILDQTLNLNLDSPQLLTQQTPTVQRVRSFLQNLDDDELPFQPPAASTSQTRATSSVEQLEEESDESECESLADESQSFVESLPASPSRYEDAQSVETAHGAGPLHASQVSRDDHLIQNTPFTEPLKTPRPRVPPPTPHPKHDVQPSASMPMTPSDAGYTSTEYEVIVQERSAKQTKHGHPQLASRKVTSDTNIPSKLSPRHEVCVIASENVSRASSYGDVLERSHGSSSSGSSSGSFSARENDEDHRGDYRVDGEERRNGENLDDEEDLGSSPEVSPTASFCTAHASYASLPDDLRSYRGGSATYSHAASSEHDVSLLPLLDETQYSASSAASLEGREIANTQHGGSSMDFSCNTTEPTDHFEYYRNMERTSPQDPTQVAGSNASAHLERGDGPHTTSNVNGQSLPPTPSSVRSHPRSELLSRIPKVSPPNFDSSAQTDQSSMSDAGNSAKGKHAPNPHRGVSHGSQRAGGADENWDLSHTPAMGDRTFHDLGASFALPSTINLDLTRQFADIAMTPQQPAHPASRLADFSIYNGTNAQMAETPTPSRRQPPMMSPVPPTPAPFAQRTKAKKRVHISSPIESAPYERTHNSSRSLHARRKGGKSHNTQHQGGSRSTSSRVAQDTSGNRSRSSQSQPDTPFNQSLSSRVAQSASGARSHGQTRQHTRRANTSGESRGSLSPHQRSFPSFSSSISSSASAAVASPAHISLNFEAICNTESGHLKALALVFDALMRLEYSSQQTRVSLARSQEFLLPCAFHTLLTTKPHSRSRKSAHERDLSCSLDSTRSYDDHKHEMNVNQSQTHPGLLPMSCVVDFLAEYGILCSEEDVELLFRRFSGGRKLLTCSPTRNRRSHVSFSTFKEALLPLKRRDAEQMCSRYDASAHEWWTLSRAAENKLAEALGVLLYNEKALGSLYGCLLRRDNFNLEGVFQQTLGLRSAARVPTCPHSVGVSDLKALLARFDLPSHGGSSTDRSKRSRLPAMLRLLIYRMNGIRTPVSKRDLYFSLEDIEGEIRAACFKEVMRGV